MCLCSPSNNRKPTQKEVDTCAKYTEREIDIIQPKLILLLGRVSGSYFLGKDYEKNKIYVINNIKYFGVHHPAFVLRQNSTEVIKEYKQQFKRIFDHVKT